MKIENQLEKARIFAYASFIGFICPVAGIILSVISKSINDRLEVDTDEQLTEASKSESLATAGLIISIVMLSLMIIVVLVSTVSYFTALSKLSTY